MTKKELEEKYKNLREQYDLVQKENTELKAEKKELGEMNSSAIGGFFDHKTRQWVVVEVQFNNETGDAKVKDQKNVGQDFAMFSYEVNKFIAEEINLKSTRSIK